MDSFIPPEQQVAQLQDPIDRLWWFAQLERGIEVADIEREPRHGSDKVLDRIREEIDPLDDKEEFDFQWEQAELQLDNGSCIEVDIKVKR